jgi:hypothetical protein
MGEIVRAFSLKSEVQEIKCGTDNARHISAPSFYFMHKRALNMTIHNSIRSAHLNKRRQASDKF